MATAQLDYILQSFEAFVDGFGKAGSGEECTLPVLKKVTEKFRGGGMRGTREVAMGYDVMNFDLNLSAFDPQVLRKGALDIGKSTAFSVRGYMTGDQGSTHTAILQLRGEVIELNPGKWKSGGKAMLNMKTSIDMTKLTVDNAVIWEIDIENNVYNDNGTDLYAAVRAAIGS